MSFWEPIEFGGLRLTVLPAGHCLGSAMLLADDGRRTLLYTGDFKLDASVTAEAAELPHADILVMESTFGRPQYRLPPREEVVSQLLEIVVAALADGITPVVHAYPLGKSQEVTKLLTLHGVPVLQHRVIYEVSRVYEQCGVDLGDYALFDGQPLAGHAVVTLPRTAREFRLPGLGKTVSIAVTGWAMDESAKYRLGVDHALAAVRSCRLRSVDRNRATRRATGSVLHAWAGRIRRSPAKPWIQRVPAASAGSTAAFLLMLAAQNAPGCACALTSPFSESVMILARICCADFGELCGL